MLKITKKDQQKLFLVLGAITGTFVLVFVFMLLLQVVQINKLNNLDHPALTNALANPENSDAWKNQIRELDLMVRQAFFTLEAQIRTISVLIVVFFLVSVFSLKRYLYLKNPVEPDVPSDRQKKRTGSFYILTGILGVLCFSLVAWGATGIFLKPGQGSAPSANVPDDWKIRRQNWPAFRGPDGNGQAWNFTGSTKKAPVEAWRISLPKKGFSSPVIWEDMVIVTSSDEISCIVSMFDLKTGNVIWSRDVNELTSVQWPMPEVSFDTGWSAPTPYVDAERIYTHFASGLLLCQDHDGELLWFADLGIPENMFGQASSLTGYKDKIIVQIDSTAGGTLYGIEATSGKILFEEVRDVYTAWASPVVVLNKGQAAVAVIANPFAGLFDFETGKNLWQMEVMSGEVALSPVYDKGIFYTANQYAPLTAIKDGVQLWINEDYSLPDVSSPAIKDGLIYYTNIQGEVVCIDAKDGSLVWQDELPFGCYSSPVLAGGALWTINRDGLMTVYKEGRKKEILFTIDFATPMDATLAFQGNRIVARTVEGELIALDAE